MVDPGHWRDINQARAIRAQAKEELVQIQDQAPYVSRLVHNLVMRRVLNHFGDDITISFTPKNDEDLT